MNPLFVNALDSGKVVVRRWWYNQHSEKDQVTVQFFQKIKAPSSGDTKSLVAKAQGLSDGQIVSALFSFSRDVAESFLGSTEGSFVTGGQPIFAEDFFGEEVNIEVTENFTPNPYSKTHEPKMNPGTGEIITMYNPETQQEDPVYRHTELIAGQADHVFLDIKASNSVHASIGKFDSKIDLSSIAGK